MISVVIYNNIHRQRVHIIDVPLPSRIEINFLNEIPATFELFATKDCYRVVPEYSINEDRLKIMRYNTYGCEFMVLVEFEVSCVDVYDASQVNKRAFPSEI
jgi:hypothetical protein